MSSRLALPLTSTTPSRARGPRRATALDGSRLALREINWQKASGPSSVSQLVDAFAAQAPNAIALANGSESLPYAELNARANQLAHHLISLGVARQRTTANNLVAICLDRSLAGVVAAL